MSNQKAFPITNSVDYNNGMDLRDYFAIKVLQGLLSNAIEKDVFADALFRENNPNLIAMYVESAYYVADEMMEVRNESKPQTEEE